MKQKIAVDNTEKCMVSNGSALVFIVMFVGILLLGSVYYGISSLMDYAELCNGYYDGEQYDFGGIYKLDDVFYRNASTRGYIAKYEYLLFERIDDEEIIAGRDRFLFGVRDEKYGYDYVRDYIGELADENGTAALAGAIKQRADAFAAIGAEYMLAVIPNSQVIYNDKMPGYFGSISERTRLAELSAYMKKEGADYYLDLTDALGKARTEGRLYNNTENSLNALGAYYVYRAVFDALPSDVKEGHNAVAGGSLRFYTNYTDGRSLARRAGLEKLIRNKMISLPSDAVKMYSSFGYFGDIDVTCSKKEYRNEIPAHPSVLVEFNDGGEWDKVIMCEYFSNTFGNIGYRIGQTYSQTNAEQFRPRIVIQFMHENELSALLDPDVAASYMGAKAPEVPE